MSWAAAAASKLGRRLACSQQLETKQCWRLAAALPVQREARRCIGLQTPLHLRQREAELRRLPTEKWEYGQVAPRIGLSCQTPELIGVPATELVDRARAAAMAGEQHECLRFIFALKEALPIAPAARNTDSYRKVLDAVGGLEAGHSLLQAASAAGFEDCVRMLIQDLRANVHLKDADGKTALHLAAERNHSDVARTLLARGRACVDARDAKSRTPLMLASEVGAPRTARVLMRWGANPKATDLSGKSSLDMADTSGKATKYKGHARLGPGSLKPWMEKFSANKDTAKTKIGRIRWFKGALTGDHELPSHIVAVPLKLTPIGYMPVENGKVVQLGRGIRSPKRKRHGPTSPMNNINWYAPMG
eukprot:TRINITY_DN59237_c0_g1_i1.p1 TRINITY_DN59237_c0_g1~~TRINITY_DN59237_c0_g1_i1.p1  ORF type:complete len:362 (+),score=79.59 TRINITY_DN59237_c0_g1_i1:92-1177(+)